jgi:hypothetical protein
MSRAPAAGEVQYVKPTSNIYTVLVIIAVLVNILGFVLLYMRWASVFGDKANLFAPPG